MSKFLQYNDNNAWLALSEGGRHWAINDQLTNASFPSSVNLYILYSLTELDVSRPIGNGNDS